MRILKTGEFTALRLHFQKWLILSLLLVTISCEEDYQPKPHGYFRIGIPSAEYTPLESDCPYSFLKNNNANWVEKNDCWADLRYPSIQANLQLTYKEIESSENLELVLAESQKLAFKHTARAEGIAEKLYVDEEKSIYGILYEMQGNSASSSQFFVTDSANHFLRGVLYFYSSPNADSLKPVNDFMQNEMVQLIESLEWKN